MACNAMESRAMHPDDATRRYELDWVRILAFGLLILYHVGMYYVSWGWHVKSPHAGPAIEPLMFLTSPWRLALLFFISGVATAFLFGRMPQGFVANRSRRLLLPLAFGMLVIVVPQAYYEVVEKLAYDEGFAAFWGRYLMADSSFQHNGERLILPTWNHLWFVAYLWCYTMVLVLALKALPPAVLARLRARLGGLLSGGGLILWPFLLLAALRLGLVARFPASHALVDDWYNHAQYLSVFLLGFLVAHSREVWETMYRQRRTAFVLWLASVGFLIWYFNFTGFGVDRMPSPELRYFQRGVYALNQWTAIVAVIGYAFRFAPGNSPARRYLTEAVFPLYILHQTAIVVYAHHLKPFGIPPLLEGPVLVVATFATCFMGFEVIRRVGWLRPLFGLKERELGAIRVAAEASR
jgi:glucans biosynthesis protein C